jgi:hypothetical protein
MNKSIKTRDYSGWIAITLMGLLYILLPSVNHTGDSFYYANDIRSGNTLFLPHHLLYNALYFLLAKIVCAANVIRFISLMNALFAIGCLCLMKEILSVFSDKKTYVWTLIFLGSCFGFMRYATTGETYIVPLFFSLWASRTALFSKSVFLTGLIAAIACLFHQIHFFWWLGLLFFILATSKEKRFKAFILYGIASCIVPIAYWLVFYFTENDSATIFDYILHDYVHYSGVEFSIKAKTFLLTPISFIRTFYQVHGYMLPLIQKFWFLAAFVLGSGALAILGCFRLKHCSKATDICFREKRFAQAHLIIFLLQLLFAFISDGNAEFMVMLPFALALFVFIRYRFQRFPMYTFALSVFIWNLSFGVVPYHFLELIPEPAISRYVKSHSDEVYYLMDKHTVLMQLEYENPDESFCVYNIEPNNRLILDSLLQSNHSVISDILTPRAASRASLVLSASDLVSDYHIQIQDTIPFDLGIVVLSRITLGRLPVSGRAGHESVE